jgi:hypothetical protein
MVYERSRFRELKIAFNNNNSKFSDLESFVNDAANNQNETTTSALELDARYGEDVDEVIRNCTDKDPNRRPKMAAVVKTLAITVLSGPRKPAKITGKRKHIQSESVLSCDGSCD